MIWMLLLACAKEPDDGPAFGVRITDPLDDDTFYRHDDVHVLFLLDGYDPTLDSDVELQWEAEDHAPFSTVENVSEIITFEPTAQGDTVITLTVSNGENEATDDVTIHVK
jgi:hypothetical protein